MWMNRRQTLGQRGVKMNRKRFPLKEVCLILLASVWFTSGQDEIGQCPHRCLCFRTTVRCMFLQLEKIPDVPENTTILDFRFNRIKEVTKDTFKTLEKLNTLLLNNNHITRIENESFIGLPELRYLYLYKNRIRTIERFAFKGLHKLEQLYIHFNKIEKIEPDTFANLPALERLFLHNNRLSKIPHGALKKLGSLRRLRLDSNTLICDCELMWLAEMLKQNPEFQAAAVCEYPAKLQGKALSSLSTTDFKCRRPQLTEEPNDVDVFFGGTAYFICKADGEPKPDIVWLHNDNEISLQSEKRYNILKDGTLMITKAQDQDKGAYECMAKNPAGEIKSRAAKMHYYEKKSKLVFVEQPYDNRVPVGSTVVLPCKAVGQPAPFINWTRNDLILPEIARYFVSPSGTLTIKNIQRSDTGIYQCIASNHISSISSVVKLIVEAPPTFLERPRDQEAIEGNSVELICEVDGYPQPRLTWTKDGNPIEYDVSQNGSLLIIENVKKSDEGIYNCHAENDGGQRNSSALLVIREKAPPEFTRIPENKNVILGSSVEMSCYARGQPLPSVKWKKNGVYLSSEENHLRINSHGDLYMFNVRREDAGVYECIAENNVGFASVTVHLTISEEPYTKHPGDRYVIGALDEAKYEIDKALNNTVSQLFNNPHVRSHGELLQVFRFPSDDARGIARAAEIYERALEIVWNRVNTESHFNLSEFSYKDILSPKHLEVVANLSGCLIHQHKPSCNNMCFHRKYRTLDGTCNNLNKPRWGSSLTPFQRLLPAIYENGFNTPIGWDRSRLYNGFRKPSARLVSSRIISSDSVTQDTHYSHMLMQWGQFLDHDLDFSMPSISHESFIDGVNCATSCEYAPPCFPIDVPPVDRRIHRYRCMEFTRSSSLCGSGLSSVFFNQIQPREQVNQLTTFIDASNVYGSNDKVANHLRSFSDNRGLLRQGILMSTGKPLLPFNDGQPIDCKRDLHESNIDCFLAGDVRANEQLGLLAMHTLWMREHNRVAKELYKINPQWSGDKIYHEARKIVGAVMQHVTYAHWLPKILGEKGMKLLGPYTGYDSSVNPSISNIFATAALRFGHTLINPELLRLNASFQPIPQGNIPLRKAFFSPFRLLEEGGIDPLMRGLIFASAKLKQHGQLLNSDLTEHLFTPAHLVAQDLAALNIQRGRDHGLPSYNEWRKFCNMSVAHSFNDFRNEIKDPNLLQELERLFGHPDNVDVWVGGVSEDNLEGAKLGPTFHCILVDQFKRLRSGDRFWYENPGVFSPEQLNQIKQSSLSRVLCDNGDNITRVTKDVFVVPHVQQPNFVDCSTVPEINLNVWTECCEECGVSNNDNEIERLNSRAKRHVATKQTSSLVEDFSGDDLLSSYSRNLSIQINAIRQQEKDFDATEQRIEGIEELIEKLQQSLKKLSKKIKKIEAECRTKEITDGSCRDTEGQRRKSEEKWQQDKCTMCRCQDGQITCWVETCAPVHCMHPRLIEGRCCPVC